MAASSYQAFTDSGQSTDLQYARGLHNGRLSLAVGKFIGLRAIGVDPSKPLAVFIENGNLPVLVLTPLIFPKLRALSRDLRFSHNVNYLNHGQPAQVPIRIILCEG